VGVQCHSLETVHGSDMLTCSRALIGYYVLYVKPRLHDTTGWTTGCIV